MTALALADLPRRIEMRSEITAGMAHLSPFGLSEQWLLRDAGDRHWTLIAEAMGQDRAVFADPAGNPIYAAFCTTSLELGPVRPRLGDRIEIASSVHAVSASRIGSSHVLLCDRRVVARVLMISAFVGHDDTGSNRRIVRRAPGRMPELQLPPEPLSALDTRARAAARVLRSGRTCGPAFRREVPVPALDFNAVGLLYFPTFSRLAEAAVPTGAALRGREIVYVGNIDPGDAIATHRQGDDLLMTRADGSPLAQVRTWI